MEDSIDERIIERTKSRFLQQITRIEREGSESVRMTRRIGESFRRIREAAGLGPRYLADQMNMDIDEVIAFEHGFIQAEDLQEGFLEKYTDILTRTISGEEREGV